MVVLCFGVWVFLRFGVLVFKVECLDGGCVAVCCVGG